MYENYIGFVFAVSGIIALVWVVALFFSWFVQWSWSWVDDSSMGKENWLWHKINLGKWKYPIYCRDGDLRGYAKDPDLNNVEWYELDSGADYIYTYNMQLGGAVTVILATSTLPITIFLALYFYPVAIGISLAILIAFIARFARRHKKLFDKHIVDKEAHK